MTNALIVCDLLWKVLKSHAVNREWSFKVTFYGLILGTPCKLGSKTFYYEQLHVYSGYLGGNVLFWIGLV